MATSHDDGLSSSATDLFFFPLLVVVPRFSTSCSLPPNFFFSLTLVLLRECVRHRVRSPPQLWAETRGEFFGTKVKQFVALISVRR